MIYRDGLIGEPSPWERVLFYVRIALHGLAGSETSRGVPYPLQPVAVLDEPAGGCRCHDRGPL